MKQNPRSSTPFAGLAAALLLTGCTPKIYTSVQRSYPARPEEAPVAVYAETIIGKTKCAGIQNQMRLFVG